MVGDFRIGDWDVQPSVNRLKLGEEVTRLEPKVMQVLIRLAETPGEVVTRDDLISHVWPDVFVTDDVLHRAVRELRRVFGDSTASPHYIETIRKRGYRLIAPTSVPTTATSVPAPALTPTSVPASPTPVPVQHHRWTWSFSVVALAVALTCGLAVLAVAWRAGDATPQAHARFVPLVSGPLNETDPAISPDGRQVAYAQRDAGEDTPADIYIRDLVDGRTTRLTTHTASDRMPAWSPDGRLIAFVRATPSSCDVFVRTLATHAETRISACRNHEDPHVAWTADARSLLMSQASPSQMPTGWRLARVDVSDGTTTLLTDPPAGSVGDHSPVVSPDGRTVAFIRRTSGGVSDIYSIPLAGGTARRVTFDEADLTGIDWTSDGKSILFSSDRAGGYTLWRVPVESGEPILVAGGAARMKHPVSDRSSRRVAYENWNYEINVWAVALAGHAGGAIERVSQPITRTSDLWNLYPQISPDGARIIYVSTQSGNHELWLADRDGSNARQLTHIGRGVVKNPRWSPDGRRIVFLARQRGALDVQVVDVISGVVSVVTSSPANEVAPAWSHDGRDVLFGAPTQDGEWNVWAIDSLQTNQPPRLRIANAVAAQPSADGEWLYYTRPDRAGLWRARAANASTAAIAIESIAPGNASGWTVTTRGLYFVDSSADRIRLHFMPLTGGRSSEVATLDQLTWPGFTISPDGAQALYARWDRRESNIMSIEY